MNVSYLRLEKSNIICHKVRYVIMNNAIISHIYSDVVNLQSVSTSYFKCN